MKFPGFILRYILPAGKNLKNKKGFLRAKCRKHKESQYWRLIQAFTSIKQKQSNIELISRAAMTKTEPFHRV